MSSGRRRRSGLLLVALVAVVAVAVGGWFAGSRVRSSEQAASEAAAPERSVVTVPVEERVLSATVVTRGDVGPATATAVEGPAAVGSSGEGGGSAVVTGVFVDVGDAVAPREVVVEVAGRPVFALPGAVPAYRSLQPGMVGRDVEQLQAALAESGCDVKASGTFDAATKECVAALYGDAGYQVVLSSDTEAADLATARTAVSDAEDGLFEAEAALIEASKPPERAEVVAARQAVAGAERELAAAERERNVAVAAARADVESALAGLNAVLVGANPDGGGGGGGGAGAGGGGGTAGGGAEASGGEAADSGSGSSGGSGGSGGASGAVGARDAAAAQVELAIGGLDRTIIEQDDLVTAATEALQSARVELEALLAEPDVSVEERAVKQASARVDEARAALADLEAVSGPTVPLGEVVFVPSLPATVDSLNATVGADRADSGEGGAGGGEPRSGSDGGEPLVVLSSTGLHVELQVPVSDIGLVSEGMTVELLDESSGEVIEGELTSVADQPAGGAEGAAPGYPAIVEADDIPPEWTGRNIRVTFVSASTESAALVVPVAAVWSDRGGATYVEVPASDGTSERIEVSVALTADGFSAVDPVDGGTLAAGDDVVVGR